MNESSSSATDVFAALPTSSPTDNIRSPFSPPFKHQNTRQANILMHRSLPPYLLPLTRNTRQLKPDSYLGSVAVRLFSILTRHTGQLPAHLFSPCLPTTYVRKNKLQSIDVLVSLKPYTWEGGRKWNWVSTSLTHIISAHISEIRSSVALGACAPIHRQMRAPGYYLRITRLFYLAVRLMSAAPSMESHAPQ